MRAFLLKLSKANGQSFDLVPTRLARERLLYRLSPLPYAERFVLILGAFEYFEYCDCFE
ncbi:MAG: hypothetical protein RIE24_23565 [Silicimonas sp.]|uniref:hypothetical protein n=1 Tax=Marinovum algicola TaxID=42444 RepID=UPI0032ED8B3A